MDVVLQWQLVSYVRKYAGSFHITKFLDNSVTDRVEMSKFVKLFILNTSVDLAVASWFC
jgi:hypothetical protein